MAGRTICGRNCRTRLRYHVSMCQLGEGVEVGHMQSEQPVVGYGHGNLIQFSNEFIGFVLITNNNNNINNKLNECY